MSCDRNPGNLLVHMSVMRCHLLSELTDASPPRHIIYAAGVVVERPNRLVREKTLGEGGWHKKDGLRENVDLGASVAQIVGKWARV
jgi:hypothetical protein